MQPTRKNITERTELLIGEDGISKLSKARVTIFGVGGVGGAATEALARAGIGNFRLIDADTVAPSNINRQLAADLTTLGRLKVEVFKERILRVNSEANVEIFQQFFLPESGTALLEDTDYILDCIDTVTSKIYIITNAIRMGTPVISSMGAGNRYDPTALSITDLSKTSYCRLARVMRRELKIRGIKHLTVVSSSEKPKRPFGKEAPDFKGKLAPGSMMCVPACAGLMMASKVIADISGIS